MEITDTQRDNSLAQATPTQLNLYDGGEASVKLHNISAKHQLTALNLNEFMIAIGDVILGLVPQEKLPDLLIERLEITRPEAMKVTADVLDFLAPLSQPAAAAPTAVSSAPAPVAAAPDAPTSTPDTPVASLADEIMATEIELESAVQPLRTMAHDMEVARHPHHPASEETHQAPSQADLLSGNQAKNNSATWNTTQSS
jgi:hypothetical protein